VSAGGGEPPRELGEARARFLELVAEIRPELHRYCARLTGSVIDGEDIVQETLAKAFYALGLHAETPPLRPWLFRIAHNTALDFLKSHGQKLTDVVGDFEDVAGFDEAPDPAATRAALARFLSLPIAQRSAVILKDVLGHSLVETAATMGTTIAGVKAALVRGRSGLRDSGDEGGPMDAELRAKLDVYASLFNRRDWDGVRALVGDECQLDLVSKATRRGKEVGAYFARYEKEDVSLRVAKLEGRLALAAFVGAAARPSYFILLRWDGERVQLIRDYRYVAYIVAEAEIEVL
jgi:RNA polymerase sigma-70 factor (ECF subfamily)